MRKKSLIYSLFFQGGILLLLFLLQFILPTYHHSSVSKIMVLASYAIGYNFLLGYTGLMSLGHAMFFASGMYAAGLGILLFGTFTSGWITFRGSIYTDDFTYFRTVCTQNKWGFFFDCNPDVWSNILLVNFVLQ